MSKVTLKVKWGDEELELVNQLSSGSLPSYSLSLSPGYDLRVCALFTIDYTLKFYASIVNNDVNIDMRELKDTPQEAVDVLVKFLKAVWT